jgi:hypothetical protein
MPTAAKLVAAMAFAMLGFFTAELIKPLLPEGTQFGYFSILCAAVGAASGWSVMGQLAGEGYRNGAESGLRTMFTMVFFCVLIVAIYEMTLQSMNLRYDGPFEAVLAVFDLSLGYLRTMLDAQVIGTLLVGGILGGVVTEWAAARWR